MNKGNDDTSPFQLNSKGDEIFSYAKDPDRDDKSNGSLDAKGSNTLGVGTDGRSAATAFANA